MSIITALIRRIRIARLQDRLGQRNILRHSYRERILGLNRDIARLERAHLRDITTRGPTSREIAHGIERSAKRGVLA